MKFVPKPVSRLASRSLLKINANSPTILVVTGVVGFGVTAVLAAKATRNIDPVIDRHKQVRAEIGYVAKNNVEQRNAQQKQILGLYFKTGLELTKVYAPAIAVGTLSAASILYGHKILHGRHVATMAAYSGLMEQFGSYRERVRRTLGDKAEMDIYNGAHGEWTEDEKGNKNLTPVFEDGDGQEYLRPFFDEVNNFNWTRDPMHNYLFLKGVQQHMNNLLEVRGHVFLNDVLDDLGFPRCREGQVLGWLWENSDGDGYVDFGFMTSMDPQSVAFRKQEERSVRLNFNVDGVIWDKI